MVGTNMRPFGARTGNRNFVPANSRYSARSGVGVSAPGGNAMSRGQAIRMMGLGAGAVAAAGLGLGGIARAQTPHGNENFYERPIADWLVNNPFGYNWFTQKYTVNMGENVPLKPFPSGPLLEGCHAFPGGPWNSVLSLVGECDPNPPVPNSIGSYPNNPGPLPFCSPACPPNYDAINNPLGCTNNSRPIIPEADPVITYDPSDPDHIAWVNGRTKVIGRITERVMNDGSAEVTVDINVKNGPMTVYRSSEFLNFRAGKRCEPEPIIGGWDVDGNGNINYKDGSIDYSLHAKFINPRPYPAPGSEIKFIIDYLNGRVPGGRHESLALQGTGTGAFTPYAANFPELQYYEGKIGTIHLPGTKAVGKPFYSNGDELEIDESEVDIF